MGVGCSLSRTMDDGILLRPALERFDGGLHGTRERRPEPGGSLLLPGLRLEEFIAGLGTKDEAAVSSAALGLLHALAVGTPFGRSRECRADRGPGHGRRRILGMRVEAAIELGARGRGKWKRSSVGLLNGDRVPDVFNELKAFGDRESAVVEGGLAHERES